MSRSFRVCGKPERNRNTVLGRMYVVELSWDILQTDVHEIDVAGQLARVQLLSLLFFWVIFMQFPQRGLRLLKKIPLLELPARSASDNCRESCGEIVRFVVKKGGGDFKRTEGKILVRDHYRLPSPRALYYVISSARRVNTISTCFYNLHFSAV